MPLYNIDIQFTLVVDSDDEKTAKKIAKRHLHDEISNLNSEELVDDVRKINTLNDVEDIWKESIPYGRNDYLTVSEIIAASQLPTQNKLICAAHPLAKDFCQECFDMSKNILK